MALGTAASSTGYSSAARGGSTANGAGDTDTVAAYRKQYRDFLSAKNPEINEQRLARHYYHGDQLDADQLRELKRRRQPPTIRNKIDRKINGVIGLIERLRQDPKAYPRTPKHEDGAEIATASIRYTLDQNQWQAVSSDAARNGAINGIFGVELGLETGDQGDPDIDMQLVDPDLFFYDPRSFRPDFSDARYMGVAKWVHADVAKEMFPDKEEEIDRLVTTGMTTETWQQQDRELKWTDSAERRIFLVEHWHVVKGEWVGCYYCGDTKLAEVPSPFVDEKGKTICRYVMGSVNVDHDGDRYGFVRNLKSLQDEVNARASKGLHILNTRRVRIEKGAVDSVDDLRREMVRPDGVIESNPGKLLEFDDLKSQVDLKGQVEWMQEVKTEIENFGPNPALIGEGIENKSGRAIALLQQAGIAELGPFILGYRNWKIRVYRAIWNAQRKHWMAERWVRVTDNDGASQFMGLNVLSMDEMGRPQLVTMGGDGSIMGTGGVDSLDVDIMIDEGPDVLNLMQDTHETLKALAQNGTQIPPLAIIETSDLPSSEKKKIKDMLEQAAQPSPFDEAVMQGKVGELQAGVRKTNAEAAKLEGEAETGPMKDRAAAFGSVAGGAAAIAKAKQPPAQPHFFDR